jgi:hypothetical protein
MLSCVWTLVIYAGACVLPGAGRIEAQANTCLPADTLTANRIIHLTRLMTVSDSLNGALRDSLRVSQISPSDIAVETRKQTCTRAVQALDAWATSIGDPLPSSRRLYVYKLGSFWGVEDISTPQMIVNDGYSSRLLVFFSSGWTYLSWTLFPPYRT